MSIYFIEREAFCYLLVSPQFRSIVILLEKCVKKIILMFIIHEIATYGIRLRNILNSPMENHF